VCVFGVGAWKTTTSCGEKKGTKGLENSGKIAGGRKVQTSHTRDGTYQVSLWGLQEENLGESRHRTEGTLSCNWRGENVRTINRKERSYWHDLTGQVTESKQDL